MKALKRLYGRWQPLLGKQLQRSIQKPIQVIKRAPYLLVVPIVILTVIIGLGLWAVISWTDRVADEQKLSADLIGTTSLASLILQIQQAAVPAQMLADLVRRNPHLPSLLPVFEDRVAPLWSQAYPGVMSIRLVSQGRVVAVYPKTPENLQMVGANEFANSTDGSLITAISKGNTTLTGPRINKVAYMLSVHVPIFFSGVSQDETWGLDNPVNASACPSKLCWNNSTRTKWYGSVILDMNARILSAVKVDSLSVNKADILDLEGFRSTATVLKKHPITGSIIPIPIWFSNPSMCYAPECKREPLTRMFNLFNFDVLLETWMEGGWLPPYRTPLIASVVVAAVLLAVTVFLMMLTWYENRMLMHRLLPSVALKRIKAEMDWSKPINHDVCHIQQDTPAQQILDITKSALEGHIPDLSQVVSIREALQRGVDIYRPLDQDLGQRIQAAHYMDAETQQALLSELVGLDMLRRQSAAGAVILPPEPLLPAFSLYEDDENDPSSDSVNNYIRETSRQETDVTTAAFTPQRGTDNAGDATTTTTPVVEPAKHDALEDMLMSELGQADEEGQRGVEDQNQETLGTFELTSRPRMSHMTTADTFWNGPHECHQPEVQADSPSKQGTSAMSTLCSLPDRFRTVQDAVFHIMYSDPQVANKVHHVEVSGVGSRQRAASIDCPVSLAYQPSSSQQGSEGPGGSIKALPAAPGLILKPNPQHARLLAESNFRHRASDPNMSRIDEAPSTGPVTLLQKLIAASGSVSAGRPPVEPVTKSPMLAWERVLQKVDAWEFDAFTLDVACNGRPLSVLGFWLLHTRGMIKAVNLDEVKLARFLRAVEDGYPEGNPYHNRRHAAGVLHLFHVLLTQGGLSPGYADQQAQLGCYLAAIVHDLGHRGRSNDYLINMHDKLAVRYNDKAPQENHHVASAWALLRKPEFNFLAAMPRADWRRLRQLVIDLVLATDMKLHFNLMGQFSALHGNSKDVDHQATLTGQAKAAHNPSHQGKYKLTRINECIMPISENDRLLGLQLALKCSDLGHLAMPRDVHLKWVEALEAEFYLQGDAERAAGLPISPLCDRSKGGGVAKSQVGFYDFVVLPLLQNFVQRFPAARPLLDAATSNYLFWQAQSLQVSKTDSLRVKENAAGSAVEGETGPAHIAVDLMQPTSPSQPGSRRQSRDGPSDTSTPGTSPSMMQIMRRTLRDTPNTQSSAKKSNSRFSLDITANRAPTED